MLEQTEAILAQQAAPREKTRRALLAQRTRGSGRHWSHPYIWAPPVVVFAIVLALWELTAIIDPYVLPRIETVIASLVTDPMMYIQNFLVTLQEVAIGATSGILAGFGLAVLMMEFRIVERGIMPLVVVLMVTPVVAIAPALVVAFGFTMTPKYIVTALMVFFTMLINSLAGLRGVDPRAVEVFRTINASRWELFRYLQLPGSMPFVFAGLRISLPLGVVGAAVAEFVAAGQQAGLGSLITVSAAQADLPVVWGSIVLLALLGILLITLLSIVRKFVLWWADEQAAIQA